MAEQLFTNEIDAAQAKRDNSTSDARAQAAELSGFADSSVYTAPNGDKFTVYNVLLLDDEQQEEFDLLNFNLGQCDKYPDQEIPGRTVTAKDPDGTEVKTEYPGQVVKGGFVQPYQKDKALITPNYNVQLAQALLGNDFAKFKAAKGKSSEYAAAVKKLSEAADEREASDPKSAAGSSALADVSD